MSFYLFLNNRLRVFLLTSICLPSLFLKAQSPQELRASREYTVSIEKAKGEINIDGILDEPCWSTTDVANQFWMSFPVDNSMVPDSLQTEVRLTYDDENIYMAVTCHGGNNYVIQTLKRDKDFWDGDSFAVVLDPMNERTNGFLFGINPAGVQTEALVSGQNRRRGTGGGNDYNVAWDNKWVSEVKNYDDKWVAEISIPFKTLRFNGLNKQWGINFTRGHVMTNSFHSWAPVPIQFRSIDLAYTGTLEWDNPPSKPKRNISLIPYLLTGITKDFEEQLPTESTLRAGLDGKVAISSSLNLDFTLNPDFSQVDVDEQVTNLSRFNVRFPERRLFFLENSDLFEDFGIPPLRPFFSRRIGLDNDGESIPILYGMRLSGNLNKDFRIGVMNLQTGRTDEFLSQNYTSFAFNQRILKRSIVKGYFHNREAFNSEQPDYNRVGGVQVLLRSNDGKWRGFLDYGKSISPDLRKDNYFYNLAIGYDSRNWSFYSNLAGMGDNYVNDMGWMPLQQHYNSELDSTYRIGLHHLFSRLAYTLYPENSQKLISHEFSIAHIMDVTSDDFTLFTNELIGRYRNRFTNTSSIDIRGQHSQARLLFPFEFNDDEPLLPGDYFFNHIELNYQSDERKRLTFQGSVLVGSFYHGHRTQYQVQFNYRAQPWGNFGLNFVRNDLQFPEPYTNSTLLLISPRMEINFNRKLFWTTFLQYNTQGDNFNVNSRIQWRFQPMSDLFLVYTDNYAIEFFGPKYRSLVLKFNYWLNI